MKRNSVVICLLVLSAMVVFTLADHSPVAAKGSGSTVPPLMLYERVPLDNHLGRIDHMWLEGHSLFLSFLGDNGVGVDDWFEGREVAFIPGVPESQGVAFAPGYNELFAASAKNGKVYIFDGTTYKLKKTLDFVGADADDMEWDPVRKVIVVGVGEENGGIVQISPATNEQVGKLLKTGGHPERFQFEEHGPMIYVNCPDAGMIVEAINRDTGAMQKWPLHGVTKNYAMALDEAHHRLFTVTRKIPMLVVFNTETGQEVAQVPGIAGEVDDAYFDSTRNRIYLIGGTGLVSVVQETTPDKYDLIANIPTKVGARSGYWSQRLDRLFVGVQAEDGQPPAVYGFEAED